MIIYPFDIEICIQKVGIYTFNQLKTRTIKGKLGMMFKYVTISVCLNYEIALESNYYFKSIYGLLSK